MNIPVRLYIRSPNDHVQLVEACSRIIRESTGEIVHAEMQKRLEDGLLPIAEEYQRDSEIHGFRSLIQDMISVAIFTTSKYPAGVRERAVVIEMVKDIFGFFLDNCFFPQIEVEHFNGRIPHWKEPFAVVMMLSRLERNKNSPFSKIDMETLMYIVDLI